MHPRVFRIHIQSVLHWGIRQIHMQSLCDGYYKVLHFHPQSHSAQNKQTLSDTLHRFPKGPQAQYQSPVFAPLGPVAKYFGEIRQNRLLFHKRFQYHLQLKKHFHKRLRPAFPDLPESMLLQQEKQTSKWSAEKYRQ